MRKIGSRKVIFQKHILFLLITSSSLFAAHAGTSYFSLQSKVMRSESFNRDLAAVDTSLRPQNDSLIQREHREVFMEGREQMPMFPGSHSIVEFNSKILRYIHKNLQYPEEARANNIEGTVYVQFIIEKDGSISHVKALNKLGGGLEEEAVRIVKSMPNWIPGLQNGKPVTTLFSIPVKFQL